MLLRMLVIATVALFLWNGHASPFSDPDGNRFPARTYQNADASLIGADQFSVACSLEDDADDLRATLLNLPSVETKIEAAWYFDSSEIRRTFLCVQTLESQHVSLRI
jgi:hypothetical protein